MIEDNDEEDEDEGPAPSSGKFSFAPRHLRFHDLALCPFFLISEAPSRSLSPAPSASPPPPEETPVASSSKATSRRSKVEPKESKPTIKAKGKTKAKAKTKVAAPAAVGGEDVEMHDGDKESDPPEEDNDSGEEELEERKAASKRCVSNFFISTVRTCYPKYQFRSTEVALDRRDEIHVEGWKVGDRRGLHC